MEGGREGGRERQGRRKEGIEEKKADKHTPTGGVCV